MEKINEKQIKQAFKNVKINTTSEMILKAYEKDKNNSSIMATQKIKNRHAFRWGSLSLTSALVLAGSAVGIYFIVQNNLPYSTIVIEDQSDQAAFELFTGVSLLSNDDLSASLLKAYMGGNPNEDSDSISESEFLSTVENYHQNFNAYQALLNKGANVQYSVNEGTYTGQYGSYAHKMTIEESYYFYYNYSFSSSETAGSGNTYQGEIHIDDSTTYEIGFNIQQNAYTRRHEVAIQIQYGTDSSLEIAYATTPNRYSYQFAYMENNVETKSVDVEIKMRNGNYKLAIETSENGNMYQYEIYATARNTYLMKYQIGQGGYSGTITYTISASTVTYTERQSQYTITKQIQ
ncbi:MAG: hypothetical protein WCS49_01620 [Bacilli bacterium]